MSQAKKLIDFGIVIAQCSLTLGLIFSLVGLAAIVYIDSNLTLLLSGMNIMLLSGVLIIILILVDNYISNRG